MLKTYIEKGFSKSTLRSTFLAQMHIGSHSGSQTSNLDEPKYSDTRKSSEVSKKIKKISSHMSISRSCTISDVGSPKTAMSGIGEKR